MGKCNPMKCLLLPVCSVAAFAQLTTGSITGYVFDPERRPIQNAKITATDSSHSFVRQSSSDASGFYRIPDLPPSIYTVTSTAPGFAESEARVTLDVNSQARVDFTVMLAGREQSITVRAAAPAIQTESSELGAVIDQDRITHLPLNQRDFLQLALLTPGVLPPVQGSELSSRGAFAMHANGGREAFNNFLLDGVDNNDQGPNRYVLQPSVDAIQQFKIATNSYSAEYGRNAGGQVNVITRSGTSQVHGVVYEYLRNRELDAANSFDAGTRPKLIRNQFGAGVGGPVIRDRMFYFADFDALRGRQGFSRRGTVPSPAAREGDLSGLGKAIIDPLTRAPFAEGRIPPARISPLAASILNLFPLPNVPGESGNFLGQPVLRDTNTQANGRLDHRLTRADQIAVRYSYGNKDLFEPFTQEQVDLPGFGDYVFDRGHNAMIHHVRVFSPRVIHSLTVGLNRATRRVLPQNYTTDVNKLWGVTYLPGQARDFGYPGINVAGFSRVGDVTQIPIIRAATTYQLTETLSMINGGHAYKLGGEMRRLQQNGILDLLSRGTLSFPGTISGSGIGDLLLGYPALAIQSKADNVQTQRSVAVNFFAQDDWKVRPSLTLNIGLRYEYNAPPTDPTNRMSAFHLKSGTLTQVGTNGVSRSGFRPDRDNFAPRIGFAYSAGHDTVVRGGYGVYYDAGTMVVNTSMYFNPPYFTIRVFFPSATSLLTLANPFPLNGGITPPPSLSTLSPDLSTSYLQHWNLNLQHEFKGIGAFSVAYGGSKGTHLIRSLDLNQPRPGPGPIAPRSPYPVYGNIFFTESGANSDFHSLQASFNRRMSRGFSLLAAYTFSKSIDDTSAFLPTKPDKNFPQDSRNYHAERGLSSFDMAHRAAVAYVYDFPFHSRAFRNLESGGILTVESGQPFTPILRFDNSNTGSIAFGADRPNLLRHLELAHRSAAMWFDASAFAVPPPYTFGSAGRNIVRGPGLATFNISLARKFAVAEGKALSIEAQAFNVFNRDNLDLPERFADEPKTFGHIFSAKAPRQIQVALRFSF